MAKGLTPTQRTLRELRARGLECGMVERWNAFAGPHGIRQDLFGFIDIIALDTSGGGSIIGVQSTGSDFAGHRRKILEERHHQAAEWLRCGGKIELWGWRKVLKVRGGKAKVWRPRVESITLETLAGVGAEPEA